MSNAAAVDSSPVVPEVVEVIVASQRSTLPECGGWRTSESKSVQGLMRRLGHRWTFPTIRALRHGPMRFARLKRALDPVSQRMLTLTLRKLERDELVYREEIVGQPSQVTYGLTPLGVALVDRLTEFEAWLAAIKKTLVPGQK